VRAERAHALATLREMSARGVLPITDQGGGGQGHHGGEQQNDDHFTDEDLEMHLPKVRLAERKRGPGGARALQDAGISGVSAGAVPQAEDPDALLPHGFALDQLAQGLLAVRDRALARPAQPVRPLVAGLVASYLRATHKVSFEELTFGDVKDKLIKASKTTDQSGVEVSKTIDRSGAVPTQSFHLLNLLSALLLHNATRPAPSLYKKRAADRLAHIAEMPVTQSAAATA
jgi:hypothetical protein